MAELSRLLETLLFLYAWQEEEIDNLAQSIEEQMKSAWLDGLRDQAARVGCRNASPRDPSGKYLREIRAQARMDAKSIADTWRTNVENELKRLYKANPRGNRGYYYRNMERWASQRGAWKNLQIGLMNKQVGRNIAQQAFIENNDLNPRFVYVGPPPVSDECKERTAAGLVDQSYVRRNPTPAHIGCPHTWNLVTTGERAICDELWIG